jgi:hypothetical protein
MVMRAYVGLMVCPASQGKRGAGETLDCLDLMDLQVPMELKATRDNGVILVYPGWMVTEEEMGHQGCLA